MNVYFVLEQLKKKYECKIHPTDKNALVIYNISLENTRSVCKKYGCSGHYVEEKNISVLTNFGKYR